MGIACTNGIPSWGVVPEGYTGAQVRWTWILDKGLSPHQRSAISSAFGDLSLSGSLIWDSRRTSWLQQLEAAPVDVLILDGRLAFPRVSNLFWTTGPPVILSTFSARGLPPGWSSSTRFLRHADVGGATTFQRTWTFLHRCSATLSFWDDTVFAHVDTTPWLTVINPMHHGESCRPHTARDLDLRTQLLPWSTMAHSPFKLPCHFTPGSVVRRKLQPDELALAGDFPTTCSILLDVAHLRVIAPLILPPVKLAVALSHCLGQFLQAAVIPSLFLSLPPTSPSGHLSLVSPEVPATGKGGEGSGEGVPRVGTELRGLATRDGLLTLDSKRRLLQAAKAASFNRFQGFKSRAFDVSQTKATKNDDAAVPTQLWNDRVAFLLGYTDYDLFATKYAKQLAVLRRTLHRCWCRLVYRSFFRWWKQQHHHIRETCPASCQLLWEAGIQALSQASMSTFWEWSNGSAPFYWRWPPEYWSDVGLGCKAMWVGEPPKNLTPQGGLGSPTNRSNILTKIDKIRARGYVSNNTEAVATINYFAVPKGEDDIQIVYDGTKSGLNATLYAPWFHLPDLRSVLNSLKPTYWSSDNDYGEMFHNFWISPEIRPFTAVDLTPLLPASGRQKLHVECWTRNAMGLRPSPYWSVQQGRRLKRLFLGDRLDNTNVFRWKTVKLNLPGDPNYDPREPWVSRLREDGVLAAALSDYVDDLRNSGPTEEDGWQASSQVAKGCSHFGTQDAARKRRPPSQCPGAWAGGVVGTTETEVFITVTQAKWDKLKREIQRVRDSLTRNPKEIEISLLEEVAGFVNHIALAFRVLKIHLNGFYGNINSWRPDRDKFGWKRTTEADMTVYWDVHQGCLMPYSASDRPKLAEVSDWLVNDVAALEILTAEPHPPRVLARPTTNDRPKYMFGDASGQGYGMSLWEKPQEGVMIEYGTWTVSIRENSSSNYREFLNIVQALEAMQEAGTLQAGVEVWVFTDNYHAESCYYRSGSGVKSQTILDLCVRFHRLQLISSAFIHVVWVSGKRMIFQGADGLSRGDCTSGVMRGGNMLDYVPLHRSAWERDQAACKYLVKSLIGQNIKPLSPTDWFCTPHSKDGIFFWCPPPAAADTAVRELAECIHTRPWNTHIWLSPNLMANRWRKTLRKAADMVIILPFSEEGQPGWTKHRMERLTLAIVFPLLASRPWRVKHTSTLKTFEDNVRRVQGDHFPSTWNCVRKFWEEARGFRTMQSSVACSLFLSPKPGPIPKTPETKGHRKDRKY